MDATLDLSQPQDLLSYLASGQFASTEAVPLSGGYGNYVFRIRLQKEYEGRKTLVVKHGKDYIPGARSMAFALERQDFDQEAMRKVKRLLPADAFVTVPEVHLFDADAHIIIMDDCNDGADSITLKSLLQNGPPLSATSARELGSELGAFLARLHAWGASDAAAREFFEGNKQARTLSAWATYGRLVSTLLGETRRSLEALNNPALNDPALDVAPDTLERVRQIAQARADAIQDARDTVVMGDFWPGNVLLSVSEVPNHGDGQGSSERREVEVEKAYVVDWELVKPGLAGMDIGQFCAEMYQMKTFFPATGALVAELVSGLLGTYRDASEGSLDSVAQIALTHIGAHLIAWTANGTWRGRETIRQVVSEGVQQLLDGYEGSASKIDRSFIGDLTAPRP